MIHAFKQVVAPLVQAKRKDIRVVETVRTTRKFDNFLSELLLDSTKNREVRNKNRQKIKK